MGINIKHLIEDGQVQVNGDSIGNLNWHDLETLQTLEGIEKLTRLKYMELNRSSLKSLEGIEKCETLRTLRILGVKVMDYSPLIDTKIEHLSVTSNEKTDMFSVFEKMKHLKTLYISNCQRDTLEKIKNGTLEKLSLSNSSGTLFEMLDFESVIENNKNLTSIGTEFDMSKDMRMKLKSLLLEGERWGFINEERMFELVKRVVYTEKHLKPGDDLRGTASIMDTGLFDFKTF
jgi:hypothetical protein